MKKEYLPLQYNNFIKRMVTLVVIIYILPVVYCLAKADDSSLDFRFVIIPVLLSAIIPILLYILRKIFLGNLAAFELDLPTVYLLDKRSKKHEIYNSKLLMNVYFFDGDFEKVIICSDKMLKIASKNNDIFSLRHLKIMSLFLAGKETTEIFALIEQQRHLATNFKRLNQDTNLYYIFIEKYLHCNYEEALQTMDKLLQVKNIQIQNHRKVLVYYLMHLCFHKINEFEKMEKCKEEILLADKNKRTFFSKSFEKPRDTGDGSMC